MGIGKCLLGRILFGKSPETKRISRNDLDGWVFFLLLFCFFRFQIRTLGLLHITFEFYWEYLKEKGRTGQAPDYRGFEGRLGDTPGQLV